MMNIRLMVFRTFYNKYLSLILLFLGCSLLFCMFWPCISYYNTSGERVYLNISETHSFKYYCIFASIIPLLCALTLFIFPSIGKIIYGKWKISLLHFLISFFCLIVIIFLSQAPRIIAHFEKIQGTDDILLSSGAISGMVIAGIIMCLCTLKIFLDGKFNSGK